MRLWKVTYGDPKIGRLVTWCPNKKAADRYKRIVDAGAREIGYDGDAEVEGVMLPDTLAGMCEWLNAREVS